MIPYGKQSIDEDDIAEVVKVLKGDWLTCGPKVAEFEEKLAEYCGAKYAVAVNSGTGALELSYMAIGLKPGDEVITTPLTFAATSNAFIYLGAKPVFVDIDAGSLNIDIGLIEQAITPQTKAIAIVDFAGRPCEFDKINEIAQKHNLFVVADGAHAIGASYKGRRVGGLVDFTTFSFHPVKAITTGEGGAVLTNSKEFYEKMKVLRHHGVVKKPEQGGWCYQIEEPGHNFRITDFQCALGISQLKKLDKFIAKRRDIVQKYNQAFKGIKEIILPSEGEDMKSAWHIYPIQFDLAKLKVGRKELFDSFKEQGIGVQVHYMPLHLHPFYQKAFGYKQGDFKVAEKYYEQAITIPLYPTMTDEEVEKVIATVKALVSQYAI